MKVTVITGSPRKNGTSNFLADEFIRGAIDRGNEVYRFDSAKAEVKNCIGCNICAMGKLPCIHRDDFVELRENLLNSDVIAFVTPVYYFGMTSSIKKVIDRFYSIDSKLREKENKAVLITVQHSPSEIAKEALNQQYLTITNWLKMENFGIINAIGIESVEHLQTTQYPQDVYALGRRIYM